MIAGGTSSERVFVSAERPWAWVFTTSDQREYDILRTAFGDLWGDERLKHVPELLPFRRRKEWLVNGSHLVLAMKMVCQKRDDKWLDIAEFMRDADGIEKTLELAGNCQAAYQAAGPSARKHWNQAFFDHIAIDLDGVTYTRPTDLMAELLAEDLIERLERDLQEQELKNPRSLRDVGGSKETALVGDKGFEPLTPCASCRCSNQLS